MQMRQLFFSLFSPLLSSTSPHTPGWCSLAGVGPCDKLTCHLNTGRYDLYSKAGCLALSLALPPHYDSPVTLGESRHLSESQFAPLLNEEKAAHGCVLFLTFTDTCRQLPMPGPALVLRLPCPLLWESPSSPSHPPCCLPTLLELAPYLSP